jgi:hypothetical protein
VDAAQRQLYDQIDDATQRLLGTARVIAEPDLRQPSLLPGWTRAHILAHLARSADAMRALLVGLRSGQDRPAYVSAEALEADIERTATQEAKDLVTDVAHHRPAAGRSGLAALRAGPRLGAVPGCAAAGPAAGRGRAASLRPGRGVQPGRLAGRFRVHGTRGAHALATPGPAQPAARAAGQRAPAPPRTSAGTAKKGLGPLFS